MHRLYVFYAGALYGYRDVIMLAYLTALVFPYTACSGGCASLATGYANYVFQTFLCPHVCRDNVYIVSTLSEKKMNR